MDSSRGSFANPKPKKVIIIQTAYWHQILNNGLQQPGYRGKAESNLVRPFEQLAVTADYGPTFRNMGLEVEEYVYNSRNLQGRWLGPKSKIFDNRLIWQFWQHISRIPVFGEMLNFWSAPAIAIRNAISESAPDIVLVLNVNLTTSMLGRWIREKGIFLVGQHASPLPPRSFLKNFDLIVSALPWQVDYFSSLGIESRYLPLGIPKSQIPNNPKMLNDREIDISFVGTFGRHHKNAIELLRSVAKEFPNLRIYTSASLNRLRSLGLELNFFGQAHGKEAMNIYQNSRIVLNRHIGMARGFAANFRMFEGTAAGAVLVTEEASNLSMLFEKGIEVLSYSCPEEACSQIRQILGNLSAAQKIASAGRLRTLQTHSIEARARELWSIIEGAISVKTATI